MDCLKRTWAEISLDNLNHNYHALREKAAGRHALSRRGQGRRLRPRAVPVSRYLVELGAEYLAVSNIEEAIQLRRGGIRRPILILGYTPPELADSLVSYGLRQEVHSLE